MMTDNTPYDGGLDKNTTEIYPTEFSAKRAAAVLNKERTFAETLRGRYIATPNHLGWVIAPVYY